MHTARAQLTDVWIDDNIRLTNNQWHYEGVSIIGTTTNLYLVITPKGYFYESLPPFRQAKYVKNYPDIIRSYRPYFYERKLGWCLVGSSHYYFYADGVYMMLDFAPLLRNVTFDCNLRRVRHLDLRQWRFYDWSSLRDRYKPARPSTQRHLDTRRRSKPSKSDKYSPSGSSLRRFDVPKNHPRRPPKTRHAQKNRSSREGNTLR